MQETSEERISAYLKKMEEEGKIQRERQKIIDPIVDEANKFMIDFGKTKNTIHPYSDFTKCGMKMTEQFSKRVRPLLEKVSIENQLEILRFFNNSADDLTPKSNFKSFFSRYGGMNGFTDVRTFQWRDFVETSEYGQQSWYDYANLALELQYILTSK